MKKIILSKTNILKAIFTSNISFHKLYHLLNDFKKANNLTISTNSISILVLNKALIDLIEDNSSSESEAATLSIIGEINYKKLKQQNKKKHPKGISEIDKKIPSKVIVLTTENKEKQKETKNIIQNKKVEIKPANKPASIRISEQKNLFSKTITITPVFTPKKKAIINASIKKKEENINQQLKNKKSTTIKVPKKNVNLVKPTIEKPNNIKKQKIETYLPKKENPKQNITQKPVTKVSNSSPKVNQIKPQTPKYKLQKKSPSVIVALFSTVSASILFGLGLATIGHKKSFSSMLIASSLAIASFGMLANNTKTKNKQLVKTNKKAY